MFVIRLLVFCLAAAGVLAVARGKAGGSLPATKEFTNSIGLRLVRIDPGSFRMGTDSAVPEKLASVAFMRQGDFDERPAHIVRITKAFYLGALEVTNRQYEQFDPAHRQLRGKLGFSTEDDEAVVFVSWEEATAFCRWLSKKESRAYRLPTEAEWEYAARAGTTTAFSTGDELPPEMQKNQVQSWYPDPDRARNEKPVSLAVGRTRPNAWGLYDVHGNVEEWTQDWYGPYQAGEQADPVGRASGDFRVARGGSHSTELYYLRSANRTGALPGERNWVIGFRVALGEMPRTKPLPPPGPQLYQLGVSQKIPPGIATGPDSSTPYFGGPREYVKIPPDSTGPMFSSHNHDPAIVECPNGDLLAIWYTCVQESGRELGILASRLRYGRQEWEPASPFWDAPDRNDHAPAMWFDGKRTIYHFNGLAAAATWGSLAIILRTSTDNGVTWSKARLIMPEHSLRHQPVESVFRTREGYILLPADAVSGGSGGTSLHISRDEGQTWQDAGGTIAGIHAGVVQLKDGRLLAFGRGDNINGRMPRSISADMGKTWVRAASDFQPISGGQRLVLMRLKDGPILFVSFANKMPITDASGKQRAVSGLYAALSFDEGETWPLRRLVSDDGPGREVATLDGRPFTLGWENAEPRGYMSVCQTADGLVHLISSRQHYSFNLAWLKAPPPAAPVLPAAGK
jgi:formylglycine-generating enzyme required for sulfatase activity